jgi:GlpG protein
VRQLQSYGDPEQARGLSDQLEVEGIRNEVRSHEGRHSVWIINETDLDAAKELASRHSEAPPDAHRAEAERIRKQREVDARPIRLPGLSQGGSLAGGPAGQATLVLIILCVGVSVLSGMGSRSSPIVRALLVVPISPEGYYLPRMLWAEPWRLLTPMLLHFGLLHLAFNMLWLYRLGSQIENLQGTRRFLGLVALTQVPGVLVQLELTGPMFGGMSGVVYGLFGFSWMQSRYTSKGYVVTDQDTMWLMGWFVLCATGLVGHIANAQHALGLVFGLLAGMPAYVAFHRSSARPSFEEGSWADLNIRGFQRFKRVYYDPYVPLWFVALAIVVTFVG